MDKGCCRAGLLCVLELIFRRFVSENGRFFLKSQCARRRPISLHSSPLTTTMVEVVGRTTFLPFNIPVPACVLPLLNLAALLPLHGAVGTTALAACLLFTAIRRRTVASRSDFSSPTAFRGYFKWACIF